MRVRFLLIAAGLLAAVSLGVPACNNASSGSGGSASSAGGAGGSGGNAKDCSSMSECGDAEGGCVACAEGKTCKPQLNACHASEECLGFARCLEACAQGDSECSDDCSNQFPVGSSAYQDLMLCVICQVCASSCDAAGSGCLP